jgi:hypothetical protein
MFFYIKKNGCAERSIICLISFYATAKNFLVVFCFSAGVVFFVAVSV